MLNVTRIDSVLFFVSDIHAAAQWYASLFESTVEYENPHYAFVRTPFSTFGFHPADEKCPGGRGGSVTYLEVANVDAAIALISEKGASLHRGPLTTSPGPRVAVIQDPFGSLLGISEAVGKRAEIAFNSPKSP
jgi:predicted enzyme related to lactoylglutathione lyase